MNDDLAKRIAKLADWAAVATFEKNAKRLGRFTEEISKELWQRSLELAKSEIAKHTGIGLLDLTPAEERVVLVVAEYLAIKRTSGSHAGRTLDQLRHRGLLGAVEVSVSRTEVTSGFETLAEADREDLSYESIVIDFPSEFSPRALWYARRTLGLPNSTTTPPAGAGITQARTEALLDWLKTQAVNNAGYLPRFTNAEAAAAIGVPNLQQFGRAQGALQSRVDLACYQCGLPPLGLAAEQPFTAAWRNESTQKWEFPIASMQAAAQGRSWGDEDFDRIAVAARSLPAQVAPIWNQLMAEENAAVRAWAFNLLPNGDSSSKESAPRGPTWTRDELILALDLYLRNRKSPPGKNSPEVAELSQLLNRLGDFLGIDKAESYRNVNGVYMKMMNFRRFDPEFTGTGKVGLARGNKDEEVVWNEFASDPSRLMAVAAAIRKAIDEGAQGLPIGNGPEDEEIEEAEEGRLLTRVHRYRERNRKLVEQRKKNAAKDGRLCCEACGFSFGDRYGTNAAHIIDCHHTKPVHTLVDGDKTRLEDLALLCANCHRVIHSFRPWLSLDQLREILVKQRAVNEP